MATNDQRLSVREKLGYGLGDTAANFIFQTMVMFQLAFYTDTFGITAAAAGTLLMVVRVWDAVFDPIMGVIADRTNTRWGKFRPWVLWTAVPFGIMGFLTFVTPDFSPSGKLIYAYVTYGLAMMAYSAINVPYGALLGVISPQSEVRTKLSSYRFLGAFSGNMIVQGSLLFLVAHLGGGNDRVGYPAAFALYALLAAGLFFFTFSSTRERVRPPKQDSSLVTRKHKPFAPETIRDVINEVMVAHDE